MGAIHLVRHAQASFGGPVYDVLSETGHRQSARLGEALAERLPRLDRVVTGTLTRQRDTATAFLAAAGRAPEVVTDARWDEYDHEGILAGADLSGLDADPENPARAFQAALDAALGQWTAAGDSDRYGESWTAYRERVDAGLAEVAGGLERSQVVAVVTSAGAVAAVCAGLLGAPATGWMALNRVLVNTGITTLVTGRGGLSLLSVNDHAHVSGRWRELLTYR